MENYNLFKVLRLSNWMKKSDGIIRSLLQKKTSNYKDYFRDKTILITGGLGFIGSNLAHELVFLNPRKIIVIDAQVKTHGWNFENIKSISNKLEIPKLHEGGMNIRDPRMVEILQKVDCVFNLAGSVSHIDSKKNPLEDLRLNLEPHVAFLESCRTVLQKNPKSILKVVFTTTRDVYGKVKEDYLPIKENLMVEEMADPQGIHNYSAEFHHLWFSKNFGFPSVSLRLTNTFGPRQKITLPEQGFLGFFIYKALKNDEIKLWGGGESLRDFNYVDDVVDALLRVMASSATDGKVYNLGAFIRKKAKYQEMGNNILTVGETAKIITRLALSGRYTVIPYPPEKKLIEPGHVYLDATRIFQDVGWEPQTNFEDGIKKTIMFYRENKQYWDN